MWTIFDKPVMISAKQAVVLGMWEENLTHNNRKVQGLNGREVVHFGDISDDSFLPKIGMISGGVIVFGLVLVWKLKDARDESAILLRHKKNY